MKLKKKNVNQVPKLKIKKNKDQMYRKDMDESG